MLRLVACGRWMSFALSAAFAVVSVTPLIGQTQKSFALPLDSTAGLEIVHGKAAIANYHGRQALKITPAPDHQASDDIVLAVVTASDFTNGTIEAEVAGSPRPGAPADARGFIGIAFRLRDHGSRFENIYLRPTNGRAADQLRRNHSAQYESIPDFPWFRLRKEDPGAYESYADLEAGAWTKMKIVVAGTTAKLYVNGAEQPCLVVNDLKLGESHGQVALWAHWSTDAHFSNLTIHNE
jgi:hypothetical protein